ncbi:hypothetical protein [Paraburkholderia sp. GAS333]|uniref:hypothetical protein n=1 Tax=Paraburkholderia sp. GAS333 TaxID=3156279 RepID=UPI003D2133A1
MKLKRHGNHARHDRASANEKIVVVEKEICFVGEVAARRHALRLRGGFMLARGGLVLARGGLLLAHSGLPPARGGRFPPNHPGGDFVSMSAG